MTELRAALGALSGMAPELTQAVLPTSRGARTARLGRGRDAAKRVSARRSGACTIAAPEPDEARLDTDLAAIEREVEHSGGEAPAAGGAVTTVHRTENPLEADTQVYLVEHPLRADEHVRFADNPSRAQSTVQRPARSRPTRTVFVVR